MYRLRSNRWTHPIRVYYEVLDGIGLLWGDRERKSAPLWGRGYPPMIVGQNTLEAMKQVWGTWMFPLDD